jgi:hypothetical protein
MTAAARPLRATGRRRRVSFFALTKWHHAHLRIGLEGFMPAWLHALNRYFPIRYLVWLICAIGFLLCAFVWVAFGQAGFAALVFGVLVGVGVRDSLQTKRAVLRNYPVIGHLRFLLEFIGPHTFAPCAD